MFRTQDYPTALLDCGSTLSVFCPPQFGYRHRNYLKVASECDSATMTCPVLNPSGLSGAVTTKRMARTASPAWPKIRPSEQLLASVPSLSQNCSFRMARPTPGDSMTLFGGALALTGVPRRTTPNSSVPSSLEEAAVAVAVLSDWGLPAVALTPHPSPRQTP